MCGGVILNEYQILSAAHCFDNDAQSKMEKYWLVLAGTNNNTLPKKAKIHQWKMAEDHLRKVDEIIIHQGFIHANYINDIAILNLKKPFKLGGFIQKAILEDKHHNPLDINCFLAGWGSVSNDENYPKKYPHLLYEVTIPIRNLNNCRNEHLKFNLDQNNIKATSAITNQPDLVPWVYDEMNICAGTGGKDSCMVLKVFNFSFDIFNSIFYRAILGVL